MRKFGLGFIGLVALVLAYALGTPAGTAVAQNVACYFAQDGATFTAGSGCVIDATSGRVLLANGATPPATCTVGEIFLDTDETNDTNCTTTGDDSICICSATNTWTSTE